MKKIVVIAIVLLIIGIVFAQGAPVIPYMTQYWRSVLDNSGPVHQPLSSDSTTFFQVLDADGGNPVINVDTDNEYFSIGHNTPVASLDVMGSFMFLGGDSRTDSTAKTGRIAGVHYDTDEEPVAFMLYNSTSTDSYINFGGGSAFMNAAKFVYFWTAANDTTTTGTTRLAIQGDGDIGINTTAPSTYNGGLDIACGGMGLIYGADNSAITRTNNTTKYGRFGGYHYTNAEQPVGILYYYSTAAANALNFGGGTSALNAATEVNFYTAANTITTTGTKRVSINSSGAMDVVGAFTAGTVRSDDGVSGTLELDDGTTEKITLVFTGGILTSRTVAATTGGVLADWTD